MTPGRASAPAPDPSTVLVLAISRLGEADQAGWWRTHGLSGTGRYVLSSAFPRTWAAAALELDTIAASRRQSELLGRETALHLFSDRLPFRRVALAWLSEQKTADPPALIESLQELDEEGVRQLISNGTVGAVASGEEVGAGLLLGSLNAQELEDADVLTASARALAAAHLHQELGFMPPYFDLSQ